MLRVLALTTLFPSAARPGFAGFVERSLLRLASIPQVALTIVVPNGVPVWPLSRHPSYRAAGGLPLVETWKGATVHRPRFPLIPGLGWRANPSLIARAATPFVADQDVVHADFFFPDGVAAAMLGQRAGIPVSIKARGSDVHLWGARARTAILRAAEQATGLLAVSAALRDDMVSLGMHKEKIAVHYTGVDLERFRPLDRIAARAELGIPGPLVVSIGNLIPLKGHDVVIRAMLALPKAHLRIVGDGPERARLTALVTSLGLTDRVRLLGPLPNAEVATLLAAADVMALASVREGLANAWVEALACGTPVVTTAVGGAAEAIDRPAAGRLSARTPEAFAQAIGELIANPPAQLQVRGAAERFDWTSHIALLHAHLLAAAGLAPERRLRPDAPVGIEAQATAAILGEK